MIALILLAGVVLLFLALFVGGTREAAAVAIVIFGAIFILLVFSRDARANHDPYDLAPTSACRVGSPTQMHCLHNWTRGKHALQPLYRAGQLYQAAKAKLDRMVACDDFSHTPCGDPFVCPPGVYGCGENIACGYLTQRAVFDAWMHSPGHRGNILNPTWRYYGSAFSSTGLTSCPRVWVTTFAYGP